jgi:gas vesicle protein
VLLCITAAAIGAGAALLLTPQSGRRSQQQLRRYVRRAQKSVYQEASEAVSNRLRRLKSFSRQKSRALAEAIGGTRDSLQPEREQTPEAKKR